MGCVYNRGTKAKANFWINWRENGANRYQRIGEDNSLEKLRVILGTPARR